MLLSAFFLCLRVSHFLFFFFFFNDTATTEIYTLSQHDALPICSQISQVRVVRGHRHEDPVAPKRPVDQHHMQVGRSEEHTSELQSRLHLVCRLLLEKKKKTNTQNKRTIKRKSSCSPQCQISARS